MNKELKSYIYPHSLLIKIDDKCRLLGSNFKYNVNALLNIRLIITILLFVSLILLCKIGYILGPVISYIFYVGSEYFYLDYRIKRRGKKLDKEALFFFEILALSLETGKDLRSSLIITINNINSELSLEFKKTIDEMKIGKTLNEALRDMKKRIPSENINTVLLNMGQSSILGNNIVDSLYVNIDYLRSKQLLDYKEQINRIPIKMSIASVIFFIPLIFLLILGPVILNLIK